MFLVAGEALFDVFVDPESSDHAPKMEARAGGSPFNVSIGLARLGVPSALLTGLSNDVLGARLYRILEKEGVATRYLVRTGRRTTISLVGVDAQGHPAYAFYGLGSADCSVRIEDLPAIGEDVTGLHFGSYSLVVEPVASAFAALLCDRRDRFVSLDPNVRVNVEPDIDVWRARIEAMAPQVDLIKVSAEDLALLYPDRAHEAVAADWLSAGASVVVVTDGEAEIRAWTAGGRTHRLAPPQAAIVDTVGAGDSFQAALIQQLCMAGAGDPGRGLSAMTPPQFDSALDFAARAASIACTRRGADLPYAAEIGLS